MTDKVDIVIYGGGIVGSACARDASLRGFSVTLIDRYDFASGASSKSSKLAHGGLRYLESLNFRLTKESLEERNWLLTNAAQMVKPLPFIFPLNKDSRLKIKTGLALYDFLASNDVLPKHCFLRPLPSIRSDIKEGYVYFDAQLDDARLVFANLHDAKMHGAHIENYSQASPTGKVTIHTIGAFSPLCAPTKGIHLVVPQVEKKFAFILRTPQDNRIFFVIPWKGYSLVGTTDTPYNGNPAEVAVDPSDIQYLLDAFITYFPNASTEIISTFAGLRPLIKTSGLKPSEIPRDHLIKAEGNTLSVVGGKYTTFRLMAEQTIDKACELLKDKRPCQTKTLQLTDPFPHTGEKLTSHHPYTVDDVLFSIREEGARTPDDWFYRRSDMGYTGGLDAWAKVESLFLSTAAKN